MLFFNFMYIITKINNNIFSDPTLRCATLISSSDTIPGTRAISGEHVHAGPSRQSSRSATTNKQAPFVIEISLYYFLDVGWIPLNMHT